MPVAIGLVPGAEYRYQWESDGKLGRVASFRTPLAGPDSFSFGVIGDFGIGTPAARANLRRLTADRAVDLAITTGDNAQIYGTEDEYRRFVLGPLRDLIATKPFWPSVGNHDYYNLQNYLRFFDLPNGGLYYSFTYGGVLFVSLDSNRFDPRQRGWLRSTLRSSRARCKVAYFHHPLWSSGRGYRGLAPPAPQALRPAPAARRGGPCRSARSPALGPSQPARHCLHRVRRRGREPERVRHEAAPEVARRRGLLPPTADSGRGSHSAARPSTPAATRAPLPRRLPQGIGRNGETTSGRRAGSGRDRWCSCTSQSWITARPLGAGTPPGIEDRRNFGAARALMRPNRWDRGA